MMERCRHAECDEWAIEDGRCAAHTAAAFAMEDAATSAESQGRELPRGHLDLICQRDGCGDRRSVHRIEKLPPFGGDWLVDVEVCPRLGGKNAYRRVGRGSWETEAGHDNEAECLDTLLRFTGCFAQPAEYEGEVRIALAELVSVERRQVTSWRGDDVDLGLWFLTTGPARWAFFEPPEPEHEQFPLAMQAAMVTWQVLRRQKEKPR